jgi:NTP pyrophosphatase (non-canonical NTP hydrolase)
MSKVDLNSYSKFVEAVTSIESNNYDFLHNRIHDLRSADPMFNPSLILTAAIGLGSECGEFQEIVKKVLFQGKPFTEETQHHIKRELGDIIWYWTNACRALGFDPNQVIEENVNKLESRYPGGKFDVAMSENRKAGDL